MSGGDLTPGKAYAAKGGNLIVVEDHARVSDGPSALGAVGAGILQSGDDALANNAPFRLSRGCDDREHRLSHGPLVRIKRAKRPQVTAPRGRMRVSEIPNSALSEAGGFRSRRAILFGACV